MLFILAFEMLAFLISFFTYFIFPELYRNYSLSSINLSSIFQFSEFGSHHLRVIFYLLILMLVID
jgi:hypothetical protein